MEFIPIFLLEAVERELVLRSPPEMDRENEIRHQLIMQWRTTALSVDVVSHYTYMKAFNIWDNETYLMLRAGGRDWNNDSMSLNRCRAAQTSAVGTRTAL